MEAVRILFVVCVLVAVCPSEQCSIPADARGNWDEYVGAKKHASYEVTATQVLSSYDTTCLAQSGDLYLLSSQYVTYCAKFERDGTSLNVHMYKSFGTPSDAQLQQLLQIWAGQCARSSFPIQTMELQQA